MSYKAEDVANKILIKAKDDNIGISNMKLQKLLYFANGLYIALTKDKPLIKEDFEVWPYGPVISVIYHKYKSFGNSVISDLINAEDQQMDLNAVMAINAAWETGKKVDAIQLSNWTHDINAPWTIAKKKGMKKITPELFYDYFQRYINQ